MTEQYKSPRGSRERPVVNRRSAFASVSPRHPPIAAAPSATASHIPDKLYFRIGEVARLCDVQTYVLRFWETEFPQLRPNKGGTGQRLFRRRDVEVALRIRHLLYDEGYTIPGARQLLKVEARPREKQLAPIEDATTQQARADRLRALYRSLCELYAQLSGAPGTPKDMRLRPSSAVPINGISVPPQTHTRRPFPAKCLAPSGKSLFEDLTPELPEALKPGGSPRPPTAVRVDDSH